MLTWRTTDPGSCFQRPRILGLWLMFSKDQRFRILAHVFRGLGFWGLSHVFRGPRFFWALAHVFRRPKVLDPSSCFLRPRILGSWLMFSEDQGFFGLWLMFSEDQRFWILAHVFRDLGFLDLGSCFQRTKGFLGFGSCFQRTKGSGSWLMFLEA